MDADRSVEGKMNKVILAGRFTRDPDIRYSQGDSPICIARFTLAVDRRRKKGEGNETADFISCKALGSRAEFIEKYMKKGMKVNLVGRIETGQYTDKETGKTVYTEDIIAEDIEFGESKKSEE